jgi:hypothetical protein
LEVASAQANRFSQSASSGYPYAFFKHKAVKIFLNFEKVFRLHAVGLHIVTAKAN